MGIFPIAVRHPEPIGRNGPHRLNGDPISFDHAFDFWPCVTVLVPLSLLL